MQFITLGGDTHTHTHTHTHTLRENKGYDKKMNVTFWQNKLFVGNQKLLF